MTIQEALNILGLDQNCTPEEINKRFKDLSHAHHPDHGGDGSYMAQIVEARNIALCVSEPFGLIPANTVKDIVSLSISAFIEKRDAKAESDKEINHVLRLTTSHLRRAKRNVAAFGAVSAGVSILTTQIFPLLKGYSPGLENASVPISLLFGGIAAFLALQFWLFDNKVKYLENVVQELDEHLSDQTFFLDLIQQIIPESHILKSWSRSELSDFIDKWIKDSRQKDDTINLYGNDKPIYVITKKIGVEELARLINIKGKALGIITEQRKLRHGRQEVTMKLSIPENEIKQNKNI
jgi:hypothetical protein